MLHDIDDQRPVLVCGRHWPSVDVLAQVDYVRPVLSARNRVEVARLRQRVAVDPPVHGVSVHLSLLDEQLVAHFRRHVEVVMTWPVNDVDALDRALGLGANGIISDEPDILAELLARRG